MSTYTLLLVFVFIHRPRFFIKLLAIVNGRECGLVILYEADYSSEWAVDEEVLGRSGALLETLPDLKVATPRTRSEHVTTVLSTRDLSVI